MKEPCALRVELQGGKREGGKQRGRGRGREKGDEIEGEVGKEKRYKWGEGEERKGWRDRGREGRGVSGGDLCL